MAKDSDEVKVRFKVLAPIKKSKKVMALERDEIVGSLVLGTLREVELQVAEDGLVDRRRVA